MSPSDFSQLQPLMATTMASLGKSALAASQVSQLYNEARSRQLQTRVTMLGVGFPQDRYTTRCATR